VEREERKGEGKSQLPRKKGGKGERECVCVCMCVLAEAPPPSSLLPLSLALLLPGALPLIEVLASSHDRRRCILRASSVASDPRAVLRYLRFQELRPPDEILRGGAGRTAIRATPSERHHHHQNAATTIKAL
jgi:hypothetical protein